MAIHSQRGKIMKLIRYPHTQSSPAPSAVAIGNFDGLHKGHQAVLAAMQTGAEGLVPSVLTFEPHPRRLFAPAAPAFRLEPLRSKLRRLREAGVQQVFAPRFDKQFAAMTAEDFMLRVLHDQLNAKLVVTGENFAFGAGRAGNIAMLRAFGERHGMQVMTVAPVMAEGEICSSTSIRHALGLGHMAHAQALLGRPYSISGRVVHGDQRGRQLGFATANLLLPHWLKLPLYGVYAVRVQVQGHAAYTHPLTGVANLGVRPTVAAHGPPSLEVHLFDFHGDIYGYKLQVELLQHLRGEKKFDSLAALTHQIAEDSEKARAYFAGGWHG